MGAKQIPANKKEQPLRSSPRKKASLSVPVKKAVGSKFSPRSKKLGYKQQPVRQKTGRDPPAGGDQKAAAAVTKSSAPKVTVAPAKADNPEKRKSGGGDTGDLSDLNRKKLRAAVY